MSCLLVALGEQRLLRSVYLLLEVVDAREQLSEIAFALGPEARHGGRGGVLVLRGRADGGQEHDHDRSTGIRRIARQIR